MRRNYLLVGLLFLLVLFGSARKQDEVLCMGLNAVVLDVNQEEHTVTVADADADEKGVFGDSCILAGEIEVVYCDFETQILNVISMQDLMPGDAITVNAYASELEMVETGRIRVQQIQLMSQRIQ